MREKVQDLIDAGRALADLGLTRGSSGNLSIRMEGQVLITGSGSNLGRLQEEDFAVVGMDGEYLGGAKCSKETPLHLGFYRRDRNFAAVAHLHSPWATALSCVEPWGENSAIPPLTPYFVMRVGQAPLLPYRMPGSPLLGEEIATAPGPFRAALLANHGVAVAGGDLNEVLDRSIEVEEACRVAMMTPPAFRHELTTEQITELAEAWSSPWSVNVNAADQE